MCPLYGRFTIELLLSILGDCVQILTLIWATPIVTWVYKKPSNIDSLIALKQRLIGLLLSSSWSDFTIDQELMAPWKELNLEHCVFGKRLPTIFHKFKEVWKRLYELVMWSIWIDYNNQVFNKKRLSDYKIKQLIWLGILEYARIEQGKMLCFIQLCSLEAKEEIL